MGRKKEWSEEKCSELISYYSSHSLEETAKYFGVHKDTVMQRTRQIGFRKLIIKKWTPEEEEFILNNYENMTQKDLCNHLKVTESVLNNHLRRLKIRKSNNSGLFHPGHVPANKGVKGIHYSPSTEFQKGHVPANIKYDGHISIRKNSKDKFPYKYIRIRKGRYELLHRVIWESVNGKIPPGGCIRFINGDTMNCNITNLMIVDRKTHLEINTGYRDSDNFIAGKMARDPDLRKFVKDHCPELIEIKRLQTKLNKELKSYGKSNI